MIWPQGQRLDDYAKQLLMLLAQRGIVYRAIKVYVPDPWCAYWDYNLFFKNRAGQPTGLLVSPYAMRDAEGPGNSPAQVLEMALGNTIPESEQIDKRDWGLLYTYETHLGPYGLYGELRPNRIKEAGIYLGYAIPPATFGTPPPIPPPPMVEQTAPAPPAPVVQDLSGATTPSAAGISALPGTGSAPPAATGLEGLLAVMDRDSLIQLLLKLIAQK